MGSFEGHTQKANKQGKGSAAHPALGHCRGVPGPPCPAATLSGQGVSRTPARALGADGLPMGFALPSRLPTTKQEAKAAPGHPRQPGHSSLVPVPCPPVLAQGTQSSPRPCPG